MTKATAVLLAGVMLLLGAVGGWMLANGTVAPTDDGQAVVEVDTPEGGGADDADAEATGDWHRDGRRATMAIVRKFVLPLNNPDVVPAEEAGHMLENDIVVGLVVGDQARAYPWWIIANYHVVNDTIHGLAGYSNGMPVFLAMCEKCSGAAAFIPVVEQFPERPLIFQIAGVGQGTFEISDAQTLSTWHPFTGYASEGPLSGTRLERIPVVLERWSKWKAEHPGTDVVSASYQMRLREHGRLGGTVGHPNRILVADGPRALNLVDDRMPTNEMVFGLLGAEHETGIAIPLRELAARDLLELTFEDVPVVVFLTGEYQALGFERRLDGELLSFEVQSKEPFTLQDQTGTTWNSWGQAIDGPKKGARLKPASGYVTEWYEWATLISASEIFADKLKVKDQRSDPKLARQAEELLKEGLLLQSQNELVQAGELFQRAIEIQPDLVHAHYNLAFVRANQGDLPGGIEAFRRSIELQPDFADAHRRLARLLFLTNDRAGAHEHYERSIAIDPDFADGHYGLGVMLLEEGKLSEGAAALARAVEISPTDPEMQFSLGRAEGRLGNLSEAVDHFRSALQVNSKMVNAAILLARTIATSEDAALGDAAEAVQWAEHATTLTESKNVIALDTLAAAQAHAGDFAKAVETARKAIDLAGSTGQEELGRAIEERLKLYEKQQPYRDGGKVR